MAYYYDPDDRPLDESSRAVILELFEGRSPTIPLDEDLSIEDIERDVVAFRRDMKILSSLGIGVPAMRSDDCVVPVSLADVLRSLQHMPHVVNRDDSMADAGTLLRAALEISDYETMSNEQAQVAFIEGASSFLQRRMAWVRAVREGQVHSDLVRVLEVPRAIGRRLVRTPGCLFTVTTDTDGLRVYCSRAYWGSWEFFGHPTSPVYGILQSGDFKFGVDGGKYGNNQIRQEGIICTLPGTPSVHLLK